MRSPEIIKIALRDFTKVLSINPKLPELKKAYTLYEKNTGKSKNDMTHRDIADYVHKVRGTTPSPKKPIGVWGQAMKDIKDPRFKSNLKGLLTGKSRKERTKALKKI